ncbi:dethiobiotin synthase [Dissulfuribacter thermophilus]|uniref:dethiobiotin synthase n=1 Tax=Dissulfuribacter thermophilus TaxID=1156395 RepID=UPI00137ABBC5|nr:dethiobiotin synthase [Dissulfuribacter thermophilus]
MAKSIIRGFRFKEQTKEKGIGMIIFVSGTDTDCGKTFVASHLCLAFKRLGVKVGYQKWVSTGNKDFSDDARMVYRLLGREDFPLPGSLETPYCFSIPASPHLAAEKDQAIIELDTLKKATLDLKKQLEVLIIEGAGGLLVPITRDVLLAQFVKEMDIPVLLVARAGVGTINHTLLSLNYIKQEGLKFKGLIMNEQEPTDPKIFMDNLKIIEQFSGISPLCKIHFSSSIDNSPLDEVIVAARKLLNES